MALLLAGHLGPKFLSFRAGREIPRLAQRFLVGTLRERLLEMTLTLHQKTACLSSGGFRFAVSFRLSFASAVFDAYPNSIRPVAKDNRNKRNNRNKGQAN